MLQIALSQLGQSWRAPRWMLPPKFVVSQRTTSGNEKPGGGMTRWTKLYKRSMHGSRPTVPWRKEAWRRRPSGQKLPTLMPSVWQNLPSGWQSLRWRRRNLPQYPQMVMVFSVLMDRRNQDIAGENCVCNDAGGLVLTDKIKMKAWVEHSLAVQKCIGVRKSVHFQRTSRSVYALLRTFTHSKFFWVSEYALLCTSWTKVFLSRLDLRTSMHSLDLNKFLTPTDAIFTHSWALLGLWTNFKWQQICTFTHFLDSEIFFTFMYALLCTSWTYNKSLMAAFMHSFALLGLWNLNEWSYTQVHGVVYLPTH